MSISQGSTDVIGGYPSAYNAGLGGLGGVGLVGLIGLNSLWGQNGWNNGNGFRDGVAGTTVLEQNVSELRKDVQGVNTTVESLGNELQAAIFNLNNGIQANFRGLDNQICVVDKTVMQQGYAQSLQAFQNTQAIQSQLTAMQTANDLQFCAVKSQINADGDATRALITQNLIDGLRAEIVSERRGRDNREIEINVQNSATATQAQLQAQLQAQRQELATFMNVVGDQLTRQTNSVVNLGSMIGSGQSNSANQTKVNS